MLPKRNKLSRPCTDERQGCKAILHTINTQLKNQESPTIQTQAKQMLAVEKEVKQRRNYPTEDQSNPTLKMLKTGVHGQTRNLDKLGTSNCEGISFRLSIDRAIEQQQNVEPNLQAQT